MMDNCTYAVVNGSRMYPLEKQLRTIAKQDGSYVVSVFDCCREKMQVQAMRGSGGAGDDGDDEREVIGSQP